MTNYRIVAYIDKFGIVIEEFTHDDDGMLYHFDRLYIVIDPDILKMDKETWKVKKKDICSYIVNRFMDHAMPMIPRGERLISFGVIFETSNHPEDLLRDIASTTDIVIEDTRYRLDNHGDDTFKCFVLEKEVVRRTASCSARQKRKSK